MTGYPGQQGRNPKASTIIEKLKNRNEDNRMPACPAWLPLEAKRIWKKEAPDLHKAGLLTFVDGPAFANYCLVRAQLKQAYEELDGELTYDAVSKNGTVNHVARPEVAIIHKCIDQIKAYAAEFGMTPAARSRIPAARGDADGKRSVNPNKSSPLTPDPRKFLEEAKN